MLTDAIAKTKLYGKFVFIMYVYLVKEQLEILSRGKLGKLGYINLLLQFGNVNILQN